MIKAMVIGCGGVASVAIHKMVQNSEAFSEILIASRTNPNATLWLRSFPAAR